MGLFDFFGKKKAAGEPAKTAAGVTTPSSLLNLVEVVPGVKVPQAFALDWPLIEKTKLPCISITATASEELALEQSKFGHYPCMPLDFDYPLDSRGKPMYPLAQINFKEVPGLGGYPSTGYLQFYISADSDVYGIDFDDLQSQKDFRVLYFEERDVERYKADFSFLEDIMANNVCPVPNPYGLSFSAKDEYVGIGDVRYEENPAFNLSTISKKYPAIEDRLDDLAHETFPVNGHKIGGYAYFTQYDPRIGNDKFKDYILLLQIDSEDDIMWGDVGVANFFIHPDDLAKRDFSKVMYTWDCC